MKSPGQIAERNLNPSAGPAVPSSPAVTPKDRAETSPPPFPVVLEGVSVFYGEVLGLSKIDLVLGPGITGIVGPNGSGKTTLMRALSGLLAPSEGDVRVFGRPPFSSAQVRRRTGFVPATECFFEGLSARRNLEVAFLAHGYSRRESRIRAEEALERVDLRQDAHRRYGTWSRGMRQRLKLGFVLAGESDLVLLDEPFLGVDPPSRRRLRIAIQELGASGHTVLISSHVLQDVEVLTRRVGVLAHGRLLGFGEISELLRGLRDRHPHRIRLETDLPRDLAVRIVALPHVRDLRIDGGTALEFVTDHPETAYADLARAIAAADAVVRRVQTLDDGLEAVYRQVTLGGSSLL